MTEDLIPKTKHAAEIPQRILRITAWTTFALILLTGISPLFFLIAIIVLAAGIWLSIRKRNQLMAISGYSTKEEWKTFVASLPDSKDSKYPTAITTPAREANEPAWTSKAAHKLAFPRYQLLSRGFANIEVVGENYRQTEVLNALGGLTPEQEKTYDDIEVFLVPEPENPHDSNAITVWMNGYHVGYLGRADARRYKKVLNLILSQNYLPTATGRLWGAARYNYEGGINYHLYARVALPPPELLLPTNQPPTEEYSLLPWGKVTQVSKEKDFLPELTEHLHGPDSYAIATLKKASRFLKSGEEREYVTVHIDGDQIGELTPASSEKFLPAISHLEDLGLITAVWARVKGSVIAIEVTLYAAKAHELPIDWFEQVPITIPPLKRTDIIRKTIQTTKRPPRSEEWDF